MKNIVVSMLIIVGLVTAVLWLWMSWGPEMTFQYAPHQTPKTLWDIIKEKI